MKKITTIIIIVLVTLFILVTIVQSGGYEEYVTVGLGNTLWCSITNGCNYTGDVYAEDWKLWNGSSCCQGGAAGVSSVTATSPIVSSGGTTPDISWNPINIGLGIRNISNYENIITNDNISWVNNSVTDIWVNESGDTMTGDLNIMGKLNLSGNLHFGESTINISIIDADVGALKIIENGNEYMTFDTTDGVEDIEIHKDFKMSGIGLQDYLQTVTATSLTWQGLNSSVASAYSYFAKDGDGTDEVHLNIFGKGTPDSVANREQLRLGWFPSSNAFLIYTEAQGTGVLKNLSLGTEGNTDTLKLLTGGRLLIKGNLTVDTNTFFVDSTNNRVGIGQTSGFDPRTGLSISGDLDVNHTAIENDDHAVEIKVDAAGYGDVKGLDIIYKTGAISVGEEDEVILIIIDESEATGGDVIGVDILATEGSASIYGLEAGALVNPVVQLSGTFNDMDTANNSGADNLSNFISSADDHPIFVNDNDYIIIGDANKFEEVEFLLNTSASNPGIKPTFEYSTGVGTWGTFSPADGTNGMRNTGVIAWFDDDIPTWVTGAGSEYLIRITRTQNNLVTTPIEDKVQIAAVTIYKWNKDGDLVIREVNASDDIRIGGESVPIASSLNNFSMKDFNNSFKNWSQAEGNYALTTDIDNWITSNVSGKPDNGSDAYYENLTIAGISLNVSGGKRIYIVGEGAVDGVFTLNLGGGDRKLTLGGDVFADQNLAQASSPTFVSPTISSFTLDLDTQDYLLTDRSDLYPAWQGQSSGTQSSFEYFNKDGDATDNINFIAWARGTPASVTNREFLQVGYIAGASPYMQVLSACGGTGICRNLTLFTTGNTNQLLLGTDGRVFMAQAVNDDVAGGTPVQTYWDTDTGQIGYSSSSKRYKESIEDMSDEMSSKTLDLRPVTYDRISGAKDQIGLIAEEVNELFPQCVFYKREPVMGTCIDSIDNSTYECVKSYRLEINKTTGEKIPEGINYDCLITPLIQEVQKSRERIIALENREIGGDAFKGNSEGIPLDRWLTTLLN